MENLKEEQKGKTSIEELLNTLINPELIGNSNDDGMKYLVVCGSTISGIGKGSTMSSIGALLKVCGLKVTCIKIDPYLNVDAGLMSPFEHGEVFVLDDGGETDLDLGNYERLLSVQLTRNHNITSGKVFQEVINSERKGEYLGKTVQMIPHVTDKIKSMIQKTAHIIVEKEEKRRADICLIEIGGTVGDIESTLFYEAVRQLSAEVSQNNIAYIMMTYIPEVGDNCEQKSKPTQNGIKDLKAMGIFPNFYICRSTHPLETYAKNKIAFFANVSSDCVFSCYNVDTLWEIPMLLARQNLHFRILNQLHLPLREYNIMKWVGLPLHIQSLNAKAEVKIGLCGKYIYTTDTYYSVMKSLQDAAMSAFRKLTIEWIDCTFLEDAPADPSIDLQTHREKRKELWSKLEECDGIIIPGGFGKRGVNGMLEVCRYARENMIPYLGLCLGMQVAVIEFCRNVLGYSTANSKEIEEAPEHEVITTMEDTDYLNLGGTLRLGAKTCIIKDKTSLAFKIYGKHEISERHRHRYEVNPKYVEEMESNGMTFSGKDKFSERMEILEIKSHPFFFATQFHPEFKTHPFYPTPVFYSFILCSSKQYDKFRQYSRDRIPGIKYLENEAEIESLVKNNPKNIEMIRDIQMTSVLIHNELDTKTYYQKELQNILSQESNLSLIMKEKEANISPKISLAEIVKLVKERIAVSKEIRDLDIHKEEDEEDELKKID